MEGYHVPTTKEWYGAISSLKNTIESVGTNLKIPNSGAYDFETGDIVGQ